MTLTPTQRTNCLVLADILDTVDEYSVLQSECANDGKPVVFDMSTWGATGRTYGYQGHHCGTSACALGYAAIHKYFNDQGLTQELYDYDHPRNDGTNFSSHGTPTNPVSAALEYFGRRAANLFVSGGGTAKDVAATLREIAG